MLLKGNISGGQVELEKLRALLICQDGASCLSVSEGGVDLKEPADLSRGNVAQSARERERVNDRKTY